MAWDEKTMFWTPKVSPTRPGTMPTSQGASRGSGDKGTPRPGDWGLLARGLGWPRAGLRVKKELYIRFEKKLAHRMF